MSVPPLPQIIKPDSTVYKIADNGQMTFVDGNAIVTAMREHAALFKICKTLRAYGPVRHRLGCAIDGDDEKCDCHAETVRSAVDDYVKLNNQVQVSQQNTK